jgi:hypothetical protein
MNRLTPNETIAKLVILLLCVSIIITRKIVTPMMINISGDHAHARECPQLVAGKHDIRAMKLVEPGLNFSIFSVSEERGGAGGAMVDEGLQLVLVVGPQDEQASFHAVVESVDCCDYEHEGKRHGQDDRLTDTDDYECAPQFKHHCYRQLEANDHIAVHLLKGVLNAVVLFLQD